MEGGEGGGFGRWGDIGRGNAEDKKEIRRVNKTKKKKRSG